MVLRSLILISVGILFIGSSVFAPPMEPRAQESVEPWKRFPELLKDGIEKNRQELFALFRSNAGRFRSDMLLQWMKAGGDGADILSTIDPAAQAYALRFAFRSTSASKSSEIRVRLLDLALEAGLPRAEKLAIFSELGSLFKADPVVAKRLLLASTDEKDPINRESALLGLSYSGVESLPEEQVAEGLASRKPIEFEIALVAIGNTLKQDPKTAAAQRLKEQALDALSERGFLSGPTLTRIVDAFPEGVLPEVFDRLDDPREAMRCYLANRRLTLEIVNEEDLLKLKLVFLVRNKLEDLRSVEGTTLASRVLTQVPLDLLERALDSDNSEIVQLAQDIVKLKLKYIRVANRTDQMARLLSRLDAQAGRTISQNHAPHPTGVDSKVVAIRKNAWERVSGRKKFLPEAQTQFLSALEKETNPSVLEALLKVVDRKEKHSLGDPRYKAFVIEMMRGSDDKVAAAALRIAARHYGNDPDVLNASLPFIAHPNLRVVLSAARVFTKFTNRTHPVWQQMFTKERVGLVVELLKRNPGKQAVHRAIELLHAALDMKVPKEWIASDALTNLEARTLSNEKSRARNLLRRLGLAKPGASKENQEKANLFALDKIAAGLSSGNPHYQLAALAKMKTTPSFRHQTLPLILEMLNGDPSPDVVQEAHTVIHHLASTQSPEDVNYRRLADSAVERCAVYLENLRPGKKRPPRPLQ